MVSSSALLLSDVKAQTSTQGTNFYRFYEKIGCTLLGPNHCAFVDAMTEVTDLFFSVHVMDLVSKKIIQTVQVQQSVQNVVSLEACGNDYQFIIKIRKEKLETILIYDIRNENPFVKEHQCLDTLFFQKRPFVMLQDKNHFLSFYRSDSGYFPARYTCQLPQVQDKPETIFGLGMKINFTEILLLEGQNCFIGGIINDKNTIKLCVWDLNKCDRPMAFIEVPFYNDHHYLSALKIIPLPLPHQLLIYDGWTRYFFYDLQRSLAPRSTMYEVNNNRAIQIVPSSDGAHITINMGCKVEVWSIAKADVLFEFRLNDKQNNFLFTELSRIPGEKQLDRVQVHCWASEGKLISYTTNIILDNTKNYLGMMASLLSVNKEGGMDWWFPPTLSTIIADFAGPMEAQQYGLVLPKGFPEIVNTNRNASAPIRSFHNAADQKANGRLLPASNMPVRDDYDAELAAAIAASLQDLSQAARVEPDQNLNAAAAINFRMGDGAARDEKASFRPLLSEMFFAPPPLFPAAVERRELPPVKDKTHLAPGQRKG